MKVKFYPASGLLIAFVCALESAALAGTTTLLDENFDTLNPGLLGGQGGWVLDGGANAQYFNVQSTTTQGGSGKGVTFRKDITTGYNTAWAAHAITGATTGCVYDLTYWFYADNSGRRSAEVSLSTGTNPYDASPFSVRTYADASNGWSETFWYKNGATWIDSGVLVSPNTWWQVRVEYDTTAASSTDYTYSLYVKTDTGTEQTIADKISVAQGLANYAPQWFKISRSYGGTSDDWTFDSVKLTATAAPIPEPATLAYGVFASAFTGYLLKSRRRNI